MEGRDEVMPFILSPFEELIEVLKVTIDDSVGEDVDVYGIIKAGSELIFMDIELYNRAREDAECSIYPGRPLFLTGPTREAISGFDYFVMTVNLKVRDNSVIGKKRKFGCSEDDDGQIADRTIADGYFGWFSLSRDKIYDIPQTVKVDNAIITYVLFDESTQGRLQVSLINDGRFVGPVGVYGVITFEYDAEILANNENFLFQRDSSDSVELMPGDVIPLNRCLFAAPVYSNVIVHFKLYDSFNNGKEIANCKVKLTPRFTRTTMETTTEGDHRKSIHVKIRWGRGK